MGLNLASVSYATCRMGPRLALLMMGRTSRVRVLHAFPWGWLCNLVQQRLSSLPQHGGLACHAGCPCCKGETCVGVCSLCLMHVGGLNGRLVQFNVPLCGQSAKDPIPKGLD